MNDGVKQSRSADLLREQEEARNDGGYGKKESGEMENFTKEIQFDVSKSSNSPSLRVQCRFHSYRRARGMLECQIDRNFRLSGEH